MTALTDAAESLAMGDEQKPGAKPSRVPAGKKDPGRAERLAQALRGNLAKRKFQARMRGRRG